MAHFTVTLPDEVAQRLARLAQETRSTPEALLREAAEDLVFDMDERIARIREGLADIEAGRTVPHEKVVAWVRSWGTENELPPPKCGD
jgi:predicted transcriptional regulator